MKIELKQTLLHFVSENGTKTNILFQVAMDYDDKRDSSTLREISVCFQIFLFVTLKRSTHYHCCLQYAKHVVLILAPIDDKPVAADFEECMLQEVSLVYFVSRFHFLVLSH